MILVIILDVLVILWLAGAAIRKGYEAVPPLAAGLLIVFPGASGIPLPGLFDLTTQRVIVMTLAGLYLALGWKSQEEESHDPVPLRWMLFSLVTWMLFSSAMSVVPTISFKTSLSQYFDYCLVYFIFARSLRTTETVVKVLGGMVGGVVVCAFFGLLETYWNWKVTSLFPAVASRFSDLESVDIRGVRMQSTFDHSILFGAALSMAIPMGLYLLSAATNAGRKVYLWSALLLMMICIYKTNSRGPWLALLISVALLLLFGSGKLRSLLLVIAAVTALVLVARPGVRTSIFDLYEATLDTDSPQRESYQWRYVLYHVARAELAKDLGRSIWGFGPESFYYLGLTTDTVVDGQEHTVKVESCDSAVVELMMDTGYVGLCLVMLLLLKAAFVSLKTYIVSRAATRPISLVVFVNLCAFCFLMTSVELFGWGQQSYMLWIVIAIGMTYSRLQQTEQAQSSAVAVTQSMPELAMVTQGPFQRRRQRWLLSE